MTNCRGKKISAETASDIERTVPTIVFFLPGAFEVQYNTPEFMDKSVKAWITVAVPKIRANKPYSFGPKNLATSGLSIKLSSAVSTLAERRYKAFLKKLMKTKTHSENRKFKPVRHPKTESNPKIYIHICK